VNSLLVIACKTISVVSRRLGFGAGATWPGEIALKLSPRILNALSLQVGKGILLVAGTNGKTTTARMIQEIVASTGDTVVHNHSGANLVNGVVSALIQQANWNGKIRADWGVFEVDENSLPLVLADIQPEAVVLLNLFRDQLDRYGEVDIIAQKWQQALELLDSGIIILNADDPLIAHLGMQLKIPVVYFGNDDEKQ
jgi:UDP-N-acetylmuramyl tripeptide synthase